MLQKFKQNNFDLIRLFAALQVVIWHGAEHFGLLEETKTIHGTIIKFLECLPGVPIFFFISGYLIYGSFERNNNLKKYFRNRFLRLFPGLWVAFIITLVILVLTGFINSQNLFSKENLFWYLTQVTIFQFFTPEDFRGFGVGNPNGSLWTLFIEFSYYVLVPMLFLIKDKKWKIISIIALIILSLVYNFWYNHTFRSSEEQLSIIQKLLGLNLIPYLFYFMIGVLFYIGREKIANLINGKFLIWLPIYLAYYIIFSRMLEWYNQSYWPNFFGFIGIVILAFTVFSFAFSYRSLSHKILKGNDISYGVYLFHMPIVNLILHLDLFPGWKAVLVSFVVTIVISIFSWKLIEQPALKLK
jgi:peptidoglycan/LPS O-acetylase OafA/YrhL